MPQGANRRRFLQDAAAATAVGVVVGQGVSEADGETAMPEGNVYTRLGVRPLINAMGTVTLVGGSIMPPEVVQAMAEAARHFVSIPELQAKVGKRIAELLGLPAAMVTAGAASALTVATAACMTRGDDRALARLPDSTGLKNEVILQKSHISHYEPQFLVVGAKLVWVETLEELEHAINGRTAMMFFLNKAEPLGAIKRDAWIRVAKAHGVPTLNDAAADVPPAERLSSYVREGFDLVAFSGGKGLMGPQASGLLLGRADLIEAGQKAISPHLGIGRGMKVGKEELIGLLTALERFLKLDPQAERRVLDQRASEMIDALSKVAGLSVQFHMPEIANQVPHVMVEWEAQKHDLTASEVARRLRAGDPPIAVLDPGPHTLLLSTWLLRGDEPMIICRRLGEIFRGKG